jgi:hypothetical protein
MSEESFTDDPSHLAEDGGISTLEAREHRRRAFYIGEEEGQRLRG